MAPEEKRAIVKSAAKNALSAVALHEQTTSAIKNASTYVGSSATITKWEVCNSVNELHAFYRSILPRMRSEARRLGYALAHHGSMRRDMDIICVPWVDSAVDRDELARGLQIAACGIHSSAYKWEQKPRGREATSFPVCWCDWRGCRDIIGLGHVDLSVIDGGQK